MDNYILKYFDGSEVPSKIKAIKAVRMILGLGLKEAKNIVEGNGRFEYGVIVSKLQAYAIRGAYVEAFCFSDTLKASCFSDFTFEPIPPVEYRENFTSALPLGDPK